LFFLSLQKGILPIPKIVSLEYFDTRTNDETLYQYTKITPKLKVLREQLSSVKNGEENKSERNPVL